MNPDEGELAALLASEDGASDPGETRAVRTDRFLTEVMRLLPAPHRLHQPGDEDGLFERWRALTPGFGVGICAAGYALGQEPPEEGREEVSVIAAWLAELLERGGDSARTRNVTEICARWERLPLPERRRLFRVLRQATPEELQLMLTVSRQHPQPEAARVPIGLAERGKLLDNGGGPSEQLRRELGWYR